MRDGRDQEACQGAGRCRKYPVFHGGRDWRDIIIRYDEQKRGGIEFMPLYPLGRLASDWIENEFWK